MEKPKFSRREIILIKKCLVYEDQLAKLESLLVKQTTELKALSSAEKSKHHDQMVAALEHQIEEQNQELSTLREMKKSLEPLLHLVESAENEAA